MQRAKKRDRGHVEMSGPNQTVRNAAQSYVDTLRSGLLKLERECLPKRRGRPFHHQSPGKAFNPTIQKRMTRRDFLRHQIARMDAAVQLLEKDEHRLAYGIAHEVHAHLRVLEGLTAT